MKKLLIIITILVFQQGYCQGSLYYVITVPAFNAQTFEEKESKFFVSEIFYCNKDSNIKDHTISKLYAKQFSDYLLEKYNIWNTYSHPFTQANWNCTNYRTKEEAEEDVKFLTSYQRGEIIYTKFIPNCE